MTIHSFEQNIKNNQLPEGLSVYLQALWYDAKGDWNKAHHLVDSLEGGTAAAIHAYLHRVEGDDMNAKYWYNKAGRQMPDISLKEEWQNLAEELLQSQKSSV